MQYLLLNADVNQNKLNNYFVELISVKLSRRENNFFFFRVGIMETVLIIYRKTFLRIAEGCTRDDF